MAARRGPRLSPKEQRALREQETKNRNVLKDIIEQALADSGISGEGILTGKGKISIKGTTDLKQGTSTWNTQRNLLSVSATESQWEDANEDLLHVVYHELSHAILGKGGNTDAGHGDDFDEQLAKLATAGYNAGTLSDSDIDVIERKESRYNSQLEKSGKEDNSNYAQIDRGDRVDPLEAARVEEAAAERARQLKGMAERKIRLAAEAAVVEAEKVETARIATEKAEKAEAVRVEAEKVEVIRVEAARVEAEKVEAARVEAIKIEAAKIQEKLLKAKNKKIALENRAKATKARKKKQAARVTAVAGAALKTGENLGKGLQQAGSVMKDMVNSLEVLVTSIPSITAAIDKLHAMSNEELKKKGYVRIPGFTRKDGTKVRTHIRKLK